MIGILVLFTVRSFAGSPITSTNFYTAYNDLEMVKMASQNKVLNDTLANYLLNDTLSVAIKAAVINALSWDENGKTNAPVLLQFIMQKYNIANGFDLNLINADDIFCLGYLSLMDNSKETGKSINLIKLALDKKPGSFTVHIILAIAKAEEVYLTDSCKVFTLCDDVRKNKTLTKDMNQAAMDLIFEYTDPFSETCPH